jgi:hypothetical protein
VSKDEDEIEPSLSQLIAARDNVRREIDILRDSSPFYGFNRGVQVNGLIGELEATLREFERLFYMEVGRCPRVLMASAVPPA